MRGWEIRDFVHEACRWLNNGESSCISRTCEYTTMGGGWQRICLNGQGYESNAMMCRPSLFADGKAWAVR